MYNIVIKKYTFLVNYDTWSHQSRNIHFVALKIQPCYGLQGFINGFYKGCAPVPWGGGSQLRRLLPKVILKNGSELSGNK